MIFYNASHSVLTHSLTHSLTISYVTNFTICDLFVRYMLSILVFESFDSRLLDQIASTFFKLQLHKLLGMMGRIYFPAYFSGGGERNVLLLNMR
jgi:hypothetical protein